MLAIWRTKGALGVISGEAIRRSRAIADGAVVPIYWPKETVYGGLYRSALCRLGSTPIIWALEGVAPGKGRSHPLYVFSHHFPSAPPLPAGERGTSLPNLRL